VKTRLSIIGLAVAVALAVAPVALSAGIHPDDRALPRATSPDLVRSLHPDDRALPRFSSPIGPSERPTLVRVSGRGFDWTYFGVGAIGGFGIALALMGATLIVLRLGHREARPA
jgi:hypothetical protein